MNRKFLYVPACLIAILWISSSAKSGLQASSQQSAGTEVSAHRALLDKYCVTCHNQRLKTADLELDTADLAGIPARSEVWEKVIRKLRAGMMPPVGAAHPDKAQLDALAAYLEASLDKWASTHPNPGRP